MNKIRRKNLQSIIDQLEELNKYHGVTVDTCYIDMEGSERYEKADEACDNLSEAVDNLEEVISSIEAAIE